jgi:hypothetical protein
LPCREERVESGAAAEVQDTLTGPQFGDCLRVATTQAQVRSFGRALPFIL